MALPIIQPSTKLLIFDCDGTIADSTPAHDLAWQTVIKRYDLPFTLQDLIHFNGMPVAQALASLEPTLSQSQRQAIGHEKEALVYDYLDNVAPITPMTELIKQQATSRPMVVISGGTRANVKKTLHVLGLTSYFDLIITADDAHPPKSRPEAFINIAEQFSIANEACQVFEDSARAMINALKANMQVTDVRTLHTPGHTP